MAENKVPNPLPATLPIGTRTSGVPYSIALTKLTLKSGTQYWGRWQRDGHEQSGERYAFASAIDWGAVSSEPCAGCGAVAPQMQAVSDEWPDDVRGSRYCTLCGSLGVEALTDLIRERRAKQPKPAVRPQCVGEKCTLCGKQADQKVAEEFQFDDPNPDRHPLTAYLCQADFDKLFLPEVK